MGLPYCTVGWTTAEVETVMAAAKAAITSGSKIISWSSGGSSTTRQIHDSPAEVMKWCQWMLRELAPEIHGYNATRTVASFC